MRSEVKDLIDEIHQLRSEMNQIAKNVDSLKTMFKSWSGIDEPSSNITTTIFTENTDFQSLFEKGVKLLNNCSYEEYLKLTKNMGVEPPTKDVFEMIKKITKGI